MSELKPTEPSKPHPGCRVEDLGGRSFFVFATGLVAVDDVVDLDFWEDGRVQIRVKAGHYLQFKALTPGAQ